MWVTHHPTKAFKWIGIIKYFVHAQNHKYYDSKDLTKSTAFHDLTCFIAIDKKFYIPDF